MDRPGVWLVQSRERWRTRKAGENCCKVVHGAPNTVVVKGDMMCEMRRRKPEPTLLQTDERNDV